MDITCQACSTRLSIPDDRLPKNVPMVTGTCPKCKAPIEIHLGGSQPAPAATAPAADAPPACAPAQPPSATHEAAATPGNGAAATPPPPPPPAPTEAPPPPDIEELGGHTRLALVCLNQPSRQASVKEALEAIEYKVHVPSKPEEAIQRLRRNKYELLILDDAYGGSPETNIVLGAIQPMAMALRRHMCVGLVSKDFYSMDNMTAFSKSVNFVISEKDLEKIGTIVKPAVADNDQFYRVFREALHEVGKA